MTLAILRDALLWCCIVNYALLVIWVALVIFAGDWSYRASAALFRISREQFNAVNYAGIAFYKLGIILLNLAPYLALRMLG